MKYYLAGSNFFFSVYPDFKPKDIDLILVVDKDSTLLNGKSCGRYFMGGNLEAFIWSKSNTIADCIKNIKIDPKFTAALLIPQFCNDMGFTIDALKKLKTYYDYYDEDHKHYYIKMIYDAYIKNNGFFLTDDQRKEVYKNYKKAREKVLKED